MSTAAEPPSLTPQSSKPSIQKKENTHPLLPASQAEASTPPQTTLGGYELETYLIVTLLQLLPQHLPSYLSTGLKRLQHIT